MPATTEFSFEKNVAPYASRYFDKISADRNLTGGQKRELQGMLLQGSDAIRKQQQAIRDEQQKGRMRDLQYASGVSALEEARARRALMERSTAEVNDAHGFIQSIFNEADPPDVKRQKIAAAKVANAGRLALNPDAKQVFDIAESALPPESTTRLTPSQVARFAAQNVPQEIIETGDPVLIGQVAARIAENQKAREDFESMASKDEESRKAMELKLAQTPLKFAKNEETDEESDWLEPESTLRAKLIVAMGTPEEQARFDKLQGAPSDRERADLIEKIQLRKQLEALRGGVVTSKDRVSGMLFRK